MANGDPDTTELQPQPPVPFSTPGTPALPNVSPGAGTALANPPGAPDPVTQQRIKILETQRQQLEAAGQRQQEAYEEKKRTLAPYYKQQLDASNQLTATSAQATQQLVESQQEIAPYRAPDLRQSMGEWMMVAAAFGALGNAFARGSTTNSLTAFSGMLEGANKGSLEAINQNYQTWEANAKQAEAYNRQALTKYKAIMDNAKLNWDVKSAQIKMVADQYQDDIMSSAAEQKNITAQMEIYDKQDRFAERMQYTRERFAWQQQYASQYTQRLKDRGQIMAMTAALRTDEVAEAAIRRFEPVAALNGRIMRDLSAKVNPSEWTSMNAFTQALRKAGGDKDVAQFNLALESYRTEVGRILNTNLGGGGALSVNAKRDADAMVAGTAPPDVILRVTKTFDQEMKYKQDLITADKKYQQGRIDAYGTTATPAPYEAPTAPPTIPPGTETETPTEVETYRFD
jgi:hypothetical protein